MILALSAADNGPVGGMVPKSTALALILEPLETMPALDSKFNPPVFDGDAWQPDNAQLLAITDFTAVNFGPAVLPGGSGVGLESSLFEQAKAIPIRVTMLIR